MTYDKAILSFINRLNDKIIVTSIYMCMVH
jgi:hypothetical protein